MQVILDLTVDLPQASTSTKHDVHVLDVGIRLSALLLSFPPTLVRQKETYEAIRHCGLLHQPILPSSHGMFHESDADFPIRPFGPGAAADI
jgi:hypothetical protein